MNKCFTLRQGFHPWILYLISQTVLILSSFNSVAIKSKTAFSTFAFPSFFSIRVFFTDTDDSQGSRGREGTIFYFTLPLPPVHEHWDIYLQPCMWDDHHVFLITTLVFTRLLLDETYHLIKLPFEWLIVDAMIVCLLVELILGFSYSDLASTITLVLQANRLTKCAVSFLQV